MAEDGPKIHIDSDWKAQAQAEKQRLREREEAQKTSPGSPGNSGSEAAGNPAGAAGAAAAAGGASAPTAGETSGDASGGGGELPAASFIGVVSLIASQAMLYLGATPDPNTGQRFVSLEHARYQIDLLAVLEAKTENNLEQEEADTLAMMLYQLRSRYVAVSAQMRQK